LILIPPDLMSTGHDGLRAMGYNARNDEIRDNVTRMRRDWEAHYVPPGRSFNCLKGG
jgi:hypothetical protein